MSFFRGRLARADDALRRAGNHRAERLGHGDRLARGRRRSVAGDAVHPVTGPRACRIASAALHDHAAGLAGKSADLQGPAGKTHRQGSFHLRFPRLSATARRGHSDLSRQPRAGRRRPGATHRVHAGNCASLQPYLRARGRLRGESGIGGEKTRREARQGLSGIAHALPAAGGPGGARRGQGLARRSGEPVDGRPRAVVRLPGRRRQDDSVGAAGAIDGSVENARPRWPEDVQVLQQHHHAARGRRQRNEKDPHHADRSSTRAPHRPRRS